MPFDARAVMDLFRAHGVTDECPACGKADVRFGKEIVSLAYVQASTEQQPAPGIHAVPVICNQCGHIRLFVEKED